MHKKIGFGSLVFASSLILAVSWAVLMNTGLAVADPPRPKHNHGGGDGGSGGGGDSQTFTVTTGPGSALEIVGVFVDGPLGKVLDEIGSAVGHEGKSEVIVNNPAPAVKMAFLANGSPDSPPFMSDEVYSTDKSGTIAIQKSKGSWVLRYFFRGPGDGGTVNYRLDGDVVTPFSAGVATDFPTGDIMYVLEVENLRVSVDTGKKKNGYKGSFTETATIILERLP